MKMIAKCSAGDGTSMVRYKLYSAYFLLWVIGFSDCLKNAACFICYLTDFVWQCASLLSSIIWHSASVMIYWTNGFIFLQLGLGDVIDRNIPSQVSIDGHVPTNVACGWWHTLLLAESPTWTTHHIDAIQSFVRLGAFGFLLQDPRYDICIWYIL